MDIEKEQIIQEGYIDHSIGRKMMGMVRQSIMGNRETGR